MFLKVVMAQATIDLGSTHRLAIKVYGENRRLKKELKRLRLRTARVNLSDDDALEININADERKEIAAEESPLPQPSAPQATKKVRFNEKVKVIPSRLQWCENCQEKTNHTRKGCALPRGCIVRCVGIMDTCQSIAAEISASRNRSRIKQKKAVRF